MVAGFEVKLARLGVAGQPRLQADLRSKDCMYHKAGSMYEG